MAQAQWIMAQWILAQWILAQWILAQWILAQWIMAQWILAFASMTKNTETDFRFSSQVIPGSTRNLCSVSDRTASP
jgi:hypothetical protein